MSLNTKVQIGLSVTISTLWVAAFVAALAQLF